MLGLRKAKTWLLGTFGNATSEDSFEGVTIPLNLLADNTAQQSPEVLPLQIAKEYMAVFILADSVSTKQKRWSFFTIAQALENMDTGKGSIKISETTWENFKQDIEALEGIKDLIAQAVETKEGNVLPLTPKMIVDFEKNQFHIPDYSNAIFAIGHLGSSDKETLEHNIATIEAFQNRAYSVIATIDQTIEPTMDKTYIPVGKA
jgi:hypothetical protein